jgi:hypothetical protein
MNGACAALRGVAADVRAGEPELFAEKLDEQKMRFDGGGHGFPVDRQTDAERHFTVSLQGRTSFTPLHLPTAAVSVQPELVLCVFSDE